MKKTINIFILLIAVILIFGVTACSHDNDDNKEPTTVAQTIIVFHPYADNLTYKSYLTADLAEIKSAIKANGSMASYRVLVYYGSEATKAALYELKLQNNSVINDTIEKYTSVTQNSETFLTNVFRKIKETSPSLAYKLISGSHGSGWLPSSINYNDIPSNESWDWTDTGNSKGIRKSFGGYSTKDLRIDITTFSNALTNSGIHPQFIIFDNCLMSNIETVWDLKTNTDYIVATPAEQPGAGFPYDQIWNDVLATTSVSSLKSICETFINYYTKNHSGYRNPSRESVSPATIALINCAAIEQIADAMKMINQTFPEISSEQLKKVQRYDWKKQGIFYDILSYAAKRIGEGYASDAYYTVLATALNDAVPFKLNGSYYLANGDECYPITQTDFSGLGCSDPSLNSYIIDVKKETNWWKVTH